MYCSGKYEDEKKKCASKHLRCNYACIKLLYKQLFSIVFGISVKILVVHLNTTKSDYKASKLLFKLTLVPHLSLRERPVNANSFSEHM